MARPQRSARSDSYELPPGFTWTEWERGLCDGHIFVVDVPRKSFSFVPRSAMASLRFLALTVRSIRYRLPTFLSASATGLDASSSAISTCGAGLSSRTSTLASSSIQPRSSSSHPSDNVRGLGPGSGHR